MKKYTPDYESGLMEIDDMYGEYVLASEHNAEIAELVEMLEYLKNKPVIRMLDWDDVGRLINKYKNEEV